jgi:hypothetical protein
VTKAKPEDFWDGKTSVHSSKKMAKAANKVARILKAVHPEDREIVIEQLRKTSDRKATE